MAAKDEHEPVTARTWTEITDNDVTAITFQNLTPREIYVKVTTGAAPTGGPNGARYGAGEGEKNLSLADLALGVSSGDRVWVYAEAAGDVYVSHG